MFQSIYFSWFCNFMCCQRLSANIESFVLQCSVTLYSPNNLQRRMHFWFWNWFVNWSVVTFECVTPLHATARLVGRSVCPRYQLNVIAAAANRRLFRDCPVSWCCRVATLPHIALPWFIPSCCCCVCRPYFFLQLIADNTFTLLCFICKLSSNWKSVRDGSINIPAHPASWLHPTACRQLRCRYLRPFRLSLLPGRRPFLLPPSRHNEDCFRRQARWRWRHSGVPLASDKNPDSSEYIRQRKVHRRLPGGSWHARGWKTASTHSPASGLHFETLNTNFWQLLHIANAFCATLSFSFSAFFLHWFMPSHFNSNIHRYQCKILALETGTCLTSTFLLWISIL